MAAVLIVIPVSQAFAATATVTVTATPGFISISAPGTIDFHTITAGTGPISDPQTITNTSGVPIDITIICNGWGSGAGNHWTWGPSEADTGDLKFGTASPYTIAVVPNSANSEPATTLITGVFPSTNPTYGLQLLAPSSFSYGNVQTTTVTLTAVAH